MSTASSASVATPLAMVRILLFICWGQLMVATLNTIEAKETKETQNRQRRTTTQVDLADQCLNFNGTLFEDKCLYFSKDNEKNNWSEAKDACFTKKGELAIFADNPKEALEFIEDQDTDVLRWWVGATDLNLEGNWEWNNGEPILWPNHTYPWGVIEPNGQGHENCLDVLRTGDDHGYNDENCDNQHQYICEIGCSFAGTIYPPGSFIHEACAVLQCNGATGRFDIHGYDDHCPKCMAHWEPHILTYDCNSAGEGSYNYHKCGNYSLTQISNSTKPSYAVFVTFVLCEGTSYFTCVEEVTFKNDNQTFLTIVYEDNKLKIQVNNEDVTSDALSSSPTIVKVGDIDYPILAWVPQTKISTITNDCVNLQGSSGILVQYCGDPSNKFNRVAVWPSPDISPRLKGLCGTANDNYQDDFTNRNESKTWTYNTSYWSYWSSEEYVGSVAFGLSWLADTKSQDGSCPGRSSKMKTENKCESNSRISGRFQSQCEDAVINGFTNAETNLSQILINDCVYDMCRASDPDKWMESVHGAMPSHDEIKEKTAGHCHHKRNHRCKTHKGTCILKTETCDGTIIERGCHGRKCECCAPSGCEPSPKCLAKQGKCQLLKDAMNCDGIVNSKLCTGNKCACCYPEDKVKERKQCLDVKGKCMLKKKGGNCDGKLKKSWCKGKYWACCYSQ